MSSVVPIFRDSAFDAEATQLWATRMTSLAALFIPRGDCRSSKRLLARKIVEAAQRGERDPERLATIALGTLGPFHRDVTRRFGLVPNFFISAPDAPEIVEKLWDFAKSAYLDNPIPSLFKERLFVFLSRFCQVRYCIVRHCGFLVGYGHSSGDASAPPQSIEQVLRLLRALPPWRRELEPIYQRLAALKTPTDWPDSGKRDRRLYLCGCGGDLCRAGKVRARTGCVAPSSGRQTLRISDGPSCIHQSSAFLDRGASRSGDRGRHENTHERGKGTSLVAPARSRFALTDQSK